MTLRTAIIRLVLLSPLFGLLVGVLTGVNVGILGGRLFFWTLGTLVQFFGIGSLGALLVVLITGLVTEKNWFFLVTGISAISTMLVGTIFAVVFGGNSTPMEQALPYVFLAPAPLVLIWCWVRMFKNQPQQAGSNS